MAFIINLNDLKKLAGTKKYEEKIDDTNKIIYTGNKTGVMTLYFTKVNDISGFKYTRDNKDLKIKNGGQVVTVRNYFSKSDGSATDSIVKYIKYVDEDGKTQTKNIIDEGYIHTEGLSFTPKKGVVTGTVFSDTITTNLETPGKNNKGLTINAGKGNDTITGTSYNDIISGGAGVNTINFDFTTGFGADKIKLTKGETVDLNMTKDEEGTPILVAASELNYTKSGNHLVITNENFQNQQVTIENFFKTTATVKISGEDLKTYLTNGSAVLNINGKGTFSGTNYGDNITGSSKADTIASGKGNDTITAGGKNDTIKLGEGAKIVNIGYADGNDTITLSKTSSLTLYIGDNDIEHDALVYAKSSNGKDLYIFRENNQYTLIKNYFIKNSEGAFVPATELTVNGNSITANTTVYNLSKDNKITLNDETGVNAIFGNKTDKITVNNGNNNINLLKGNDTVTFGAEYTGTTTVKTGGGTDTVKVSGSDNLMVTRDGNDINIYTVTEVEDSEAQITHIAAIDNYQDITSTVSVKNKNNKVIETLKSGSGKLNGTKGDDIIIGSANNDTITGGKGINEIYTRGGNDTVVIGNSGYNLIDATENANDSKVNVKTNNLHAGSFSKQDKNLSYSYGVNNFTYYDFFNDGKSTADLYTTVGKTSYHIVNETSDDADYSAKEDNNIVFLTANEGTDQVYKASAKTNIVHAYNDAEIRYNGGHDVYYTNTESDNTYIATLNEKTNLEIDDIGGNNDTLTLNNEAENLRLFFNVDNNEETVYDDNGYLLYNSDSLDYKHVKNITKGDTTGSISVIESFDQLLDNRSGKIENVNTSDYTLDMDGWSEYVSGKVQAWLVANRKTSVAQVLGLKETSANKKLLNSLINVYKEASYDDYINSVVEDEDFNSLKNQNFEDLSFVKSGNDLVVYGMVPVVPEVPDESAEPKTQKGVLFTAENYFDGEPKETTFFAKGDKAKYTLGSDDVPIIIKSQENVAMDSVVRTIKFATDSETSDYAKTHLTITDGQDATLIFDDKQYLDFYTKKGGEFEYKEGDPLIYKGSLKSDGTSGPDEWKKGGNNLTVGDVQIDNVDGKTANILIRDKEGLTKTIIVDSGNIDGTFENEIIVGSNSADTINAMGGDDLIYSGAGDDTLNFVKPTAGEATGNNTAPMVVIGGSDYLPANHAVSAISVYDTAGSDTYNTTFDVGLYVEDIKSDNTDVDTINISAEGMTSDNIRYMFDVYNPKYILDPTLERPTFYEDLFIIDTQNYGRMTASLALSFISGKYKTTSAVMESVQGSIGYVWVDDHYGTAQKIENINLNDSELITEYDPTKLTPSEGDSYAQTLYQAVSAFLSSKGYDSAWSVVEKDTSPMHRDSMALFTLYGKSQADLLAGLTPQG